MKLNFLELFKQVKMQMKMKLNFLELFKQVKMQMKICAPVHR